MSNLTTFIKEADAYKDKISHYSMTNQEKYLAYARSHYIENNISTEYYIDGITKCYDFMMETAALPEISLSEDIILNFYHLLYQKNITNPMESYRTTDKNEDGKATITSASDIPHLMGHYANQIYTSGFSLHPIELAAFAHKRLIDIQPFPKGNKQIALFVMNVILIHAGYPPITIPKHLQNEYEEILSSTKNVLQIESFIEFIADCVIRSEQEYLAIVS